MRLPGTLSLSVTCPQGGSREGMLVFCGISLADGLGLAGCPCVYASSVVSGPASFVGERPCSLTHLPMLLLNSHSTASRAVGNPERLGDSYRRLLTAIARHCINTSWRLFSARYASSSPSSLSRILAALSSSRGKGGIS